MRRLLPLGALLAAACGGDPEPAMPTNTKTVPTVVEQYQRRSLVTWRAMAGALPAEERAARLWALSVLEKDPLGSLDLLLDGLDDPDASVRLAAIVATGRLAPPSPRAAEKLVAFFEAPEEPLRRHARAAAGKLGAAALEPLGKALGDAKGRVRWAALDALVGLGAAGAPLIPEVEELSLKDESARVRRLARFALPRLGPQGIAVAVRLWRTDDAVERAEIGAGLSLVGSAVVPAMAALLEDEDEVLAAQAALLLVDLGPAAAPALEALLKALRRADMVRFSAAEALLAIGAPAMERVRPLAQSEDAGVAAIAEHILDTWKAR